MNTQNTQKVYCITCKSLDCEYEKEVLRTGFRSEGAVTYQVGMHTKPKEEAK